MRSMLARLAMYADEDMTACRWRWLCDLNDWLIQHGW